MGSPEDATRPVVEVSVITTLFNESDSVVELLDSLINGTLRPHDVVVADGGSTDDTVALLERYSSQHPEVRILTDAGSRSTGRNAAIDAARYEHIVCIDGGCEAEPTWLEEITKPLTAGVEWVAGFYRPKGKTSLSTAIGLTMVFVEEEVVFPDFLPSARSMAFHRKLWDEVGGFPEDAQFGEDTAFCEALVAAGYVPTFAPEAVVKWWPPSGLVAQTRTTFAWGRSDGHLGLRSIHYRYLFPRFAGAGALVLLGVLLDRRILLLAPLPLIPMTYRMSRQKYRHMDGRLKWLWIPLATINGLAFSLAGYVTGYVERRVAGKR